MKSLIKGTVALLFLTMFLHSCQEYDDTELQEIPQHVITKLIDMGFNPDGILIVPEGYLIERDIIIRPEDLADDHKKKGRTIKQYSTDNLVSVGGTRTISLYMPSGNGPNNFNSNYQNALDIAIARFNAENLTLVMQRANSSNTADIVFTRLSGFLEGQGVLGSAGFPTNAGDPYNEIQMAGKLDKGRRGFSTAAIASIIAHEMGHCIGFRHTDYFDRSLSCGGSPSDEGDAGIGANHITGTPTGFSAESWMLSCSGGQDRPFNSDDQEALDVLY